MVLVVVGTMKAGKSTTINAIVGREILPNRNRPMTALPTLIERKPGQKTPVLRFAKRKPIQGLIKQLRAETRKLGPKAFGKLEADKDLQEALKRVQDSLDIAETHEGEENIFHFLAFLNDLVRLSKKFEIPFPYGEYRATADFPRIEIEFSIFRGWAAKSTGNS